MAESSRSLTVNMQVGAYLGESLKRITAFVALAVTWNLGATQNLVITNARIVGETA